MDPSILLAVSLRPEYATTLLVVALSNAVTVRVVSQHQPLVQAPATQRGIVVVLPTGADIGAVHLEAVNADGVVIAKVSVAEPQVSIGHANWDYCSAMS